MNAGKIVLGVLAGVAVGATMGILFAPDKGTATRHKITKKSGDYADKLGDKFNEFVEAMTEKFEAMKEEAIHMAKGAGKASEEVIEDVKSAVK